MLETAPPLNPQPSTRSPKLQPLIPTHKRARPTTCTRSKNLPASSLLLSSLELSDTTVYESYIRALFGTASHFCEKLLDVATEVAATAPTQPSAVEKIWHTSDSQGQNLALATGERHGRVPSSDLHEVEEFLDVAPVVVIDLQNLQCQRHTLISHEVLTQSF